MDSTTSTKVKPLLPTEETIDHIRSIHAANPSAAGFSAGYTFCRRSIASFEGSACLRWDKKSLEIALSVKRHYPDETLGLTFPTAPSSVRLSSEVKHSGRVLAQTRGEAKPQSEMLSQEIVAAAAATPDHAPRDGWRAGELHFRE